MKEIFLIVHFIGLAMGLGTSIAMMFLVLQLPKCQQKMPKNLEQAHPYCFEWGRSDWYC